VEQLIREGLRRNLDVRQRENQLSQERAALTEARGGFFPSLDLQARYSRAEGGRTIDFPVGDLLNPVYRTLEAQTPDATFPTVENQTIPFLREREQETTLQVSQPLFAPRVWYGTQAQRRSVEAQQSAVEAARRRLVRDIRVAYLQYQQAAESVGVLEAALERVQENRRTQARLVDAGRALQDGLFRAEAEVLAVRQDLDEAQAQRRKALRSLNAVLNRPLEASLPPARRTAAARVTQRTADVLAPLGASGVPSDTLRSTWARRAKRQRPELAQLDASVRAAQSQRQVAQTRYLPEVSLAVESGIQGETYGFEGEQSFVLGSVVLRWNLFNGFADRARVQQAALRADRLRLQREATAQQIDVQVQAALDDVAVARRSLQTAQARVKAARESFRLVRRRVEAGRASQVAFVDARSALTQAELNQTVTQFALLIRLAELEFATALYPLSEVECCRR
jgi:outer membrane protein TolC